MHFIFGAWETRYNYKGQLQEGCGYWLNPIEKNPNFEMVFSGESNGLYMGIDHTMYSVCIINIHFSYVCARILS